MKHGIFCEMFDTHLSNWQEKKKEEAEKRQAQ